MNPSNSVTSTIEFLFILSGATLVGAFFQLPEKRMDIILILIILVLLRFIFVDKLLRKS